MQTYIDEPIVLHDPKILTSPDQVTHINLTPSSPTHWLIERLIRSDVQCKEQFAIHVDAYTTSVLYFIIRVIGNYTVTVDIKLLGVEANVRVVIAYFLELNAQLHFESIQNHISPYTTSSISSRGILYGQSYVYNHGRVCITADAYHSNAHQESKHILPNPNARALAFPTLEIHNSKVKCSHGAAVGHIDQDALHYLSIRGFDTEEAEHQLLDAFIQELFVDAPEYIQRAL